MTTPLTPLQWECANVLSAYVGQTVQVLTSEYTNNVAADAVRDSKGTFKSSTLRSLEAKGFIRIDLAYWKGATITVLKGI